MKRTTPHAKRKPAKVRRQSSALSLYEMAAMITDVLAVNVKLMQRMDRIERTTTRPIGFSTDCVATQDVGDGEEADDYETGGA